jgi:hypothetical protein
MIPRLSGETIRKGGEKKAGRSITRVHYNPTSILPFAQKNITLRRRKNHMFLPTARFERAIFALQVQRLTTWPSRRLIGQI